MSELNEKVQFSKTKEGIQNLLVRESDQKPPIIDNNFGNELVEKFGGSKAVEPGSVQAGFYYGFLATKQQLSNGEPVQLITHPPTAVVEVGKNWADLNSSSITNPLTEIRGVVSMGNKDGIQKLSSPLIQEDHQSSHIQALTDAMKQAVVYTPSGSTKVEDGAVLGQIAALADSAFIEISHSPLSRGEKLLDDKQMDTLSGVLAETGLGRFSCTEDPFAQGFLVMANKALSANKEIQDAVNSMSAEGEVPKDVIDRVRSNSTAPAMVRLGVFDNALNDILGKGFDVSKRGQLLAEVWKNNPRLVVTSLAKSSERRLKEVFTKLTSNQETDQLFR